jgi:hypothetical protein
MELSLGQYQQRPRPTYVGLEEVDDALWNVYLGPLWLDRFLEKELRIEDALGTRRRRKVLPMYQE